LQLEDLRDVVDVAVRERKLRVLCGLLYQLKQVLTGLLKHHSVVSFVSWNGRHVLEGVSESGERAETGTSASHARLLNHLNGLVGINSLETCQDVVHRVHEFEVLNLDGVHHLLEHITHIDA